MFVNLEIELLHTISISTRRYLALILYFQILLLLNNFDLYAQDRAISVVPQKGNRVALVIGNSRYKYAPLKNPVNDAEDITKVLKQCNFTVISVYNASRTDIRKSVREFSTRIETADVGLFYYAGHGIQIDGENYLIPIDADVSGEYEVEDECLRISNILKSMRYSKGRLNIVILDACRINPFRTQFRSQTTGLARMEAPAGTLLAYATSPGSIAADGDGRNGLYTSKLLEHMKCPGLSIEELFKKVRSEVMEITSNKQIPWETSSLVGSFSFFSTDHTDGLPVDLTKPVPIRTSSQPRFYFDPSTSPSNFRECKDRFSRESSMIIYDAFLKKRWHLIENDMIFTWEDADRYCRDLKGNYRLPTMAELKSLMTKDTLDGEWGRINGLFFPKNARSDKYWTSEPGFLGGSVYVDFKNGRSSIMSTSNYGALIAISNDDTSP
jgi:hypothetical protein